MYFTEIKTLVATELSAVKRLFQDDCNSNIALVNEIILHLANSESKLIRPIITILCAKLAEYNGTQHLNIAAAIEMLHTATLIHDDIVDDSDMRRDSISANYKWGNDVAVLAGDFLLAKSAQHIAELGNIPILQTLTTAMCTIAEGEMLQLINKNNLAITEKIYLQIITAKTATLFTLAATLPAMLNNAPIAQHDALAAYGLHLGIAFQLMDDVHDLQAPSNNTTGKMIAADLLEGRITLPIIYLLQHGTAKEKNLIQKIISKKSLQIWPELHAAIARSEAFAYTIERVELELELAKLAIKDFISSPYKDAAGALLNFVLAHNY